MPSPSVVTSPIASLRRLPSAQAVQILRSTKEAFRFPNNAEVRSMAVRFDHKRMSYGTREFVHRLGPQLAYANPSIPFTFDRLDPQPGSSRQTSGRASKSASSSVSEEGEPTTSSAVASGSGSGSSSTQSASTSTTTTEDLTGWRARFRKAQAGAKGKGSAPMEIELDFFNAPSQTINFSGMQGIDLIEQILRAAGKDLPAGIASSEETLMIEETMLLEGDAPVVEESNTDADGDISENVVRDQTLNPVESATPKDQVMA